jgi:O-antigen ligase
MVIAFLSSALAAAGALALMGLWALVLPLYAAGIVMALARPRQFAFVLLILAIALEPGAIDFTGPLADAAWQMPPGFENALGLTTSPLEVLLALTALVAVVRLPSRVHLPLIVWAVPVVIAMGMLYGMYRGGPMNLAYHEARGVFAALAVFVLALRTLPTDPRSLTRSVLLAETFLALVVLFRYFAYVRTGTAGVPLDFVFSHETSVIFGAGLVIGALTLIRNGGSLLERILLLAYCFLVAIAMVATGRRAATLVMLVGVLSLGVLLLPKRPKLVILVSIPLIIGGSAYLSAYWNQEYGARAQPARAIRSQFDPSLRDESSDNYRVIEKYNVIQTIRSNRVFGVGFGRPFYQFQPMPDLTSFWSLQMYTPHQNVLWLWLKMGVIGMSVMLGFAVTALARCLSILRLRAYDGQWETAAVALAMSLMFLMFATVDLGFVGARSVAVGAIATAMAFMLHQPTEETT